MKLIRGTALGFGLAISVLQAGRALLWWRRPENVAEWFYFIDAYLVGALLIAGSIIARRHQNVGRLIIAAGWGFSCGILYRSFFEHLKDVSRHGGHENFVLACKGVLLALSVVGLASLFLAGIRHRPNKAPEPTPASVTPRTNERESK
jgi:hypothetical protein